MEDLFRFVTVRGAQAAGADIAIPLVGSSGTTPFQDALRKDRGKNGFRPMAETARRYEMAGATTPPAGKLKVGFADPISTLALAPKMPSFYDKLQTCSVPGGCTTVAALDKIVQSVFGKKSTDLASSAEFKSDTDRVHDSLIALFLAPSNARMAVGEPSIVPVDAPAPPDVAMDAAAGEPPPALPLSHQVPIRPLAGYARLLDVIARTGRADATLEAPGAVAAALLRTLLLPPTIFPIDPARKIKPAGIADLLVVKQHLKGYDKGEVCHVENLLQGETRSHADKHTLTTETTVTTETEKTTETTKELKSTERFELKSEIESTLKQDTRVKAGVDVSAKFGTTVEVNANVSVAYNTSKEEASKSASTYAREITKRASSKVTESIKTREITKTVETFYDEESHGFDNSTGKKPVRGVYQWLNKVYTAQVFNYGKRVLFDLTVPEPAAFLKIGAGTKTAKPQPPRCFTDNGLPTGNPILAKQLSDDPDSTLPHYYFGKYVAQYGMTGVAAPPAARIIVARSLRVTQASTDVLSNLILTDPDVNVEIPDGYYLAAIRIKGQYTRKNTSKDPGFAFFVGGRALSTRSRVLPPPPPFSDFDAVFPALPTPPPGAPPGDPLGEIAESEGETGTVPLGLQTTNVATATFALELHCKRSSVSYEKWQLETFSAIVAAYEKAYGEYRDRLTVYNSFTPQADVVVGGSPDENVAIQKRELKKAAIQVLADRDLIDEPLGAIDDTVPANMDRKFPRPILATAQQQGSFIRFFEQAFEWEEMTYFYYPYYWGRTSTWYDKVTAQNDDPLFLEFLKAGEARVVVPVRPNFEADVWYYLMTGEIWCGGDLPHIGDTDYLPIVEEIKAQTGAPGAEKAQDPPWEITLPTQLVLLRNDGKLPAWKRTGDWAWTDDPPHYI